MISFCTTVLGQDFYGYVKKADSTFSPVFQAKVEITEGDKPFIILKTYFDGSFKFTPNKNRTYILKISYSGYTDTAYTVTTDKNAKTSVQNITVSLKKDGMRLMGVIKSHEEDFPIKGATIVLKNVMMRKEDRITTDIDGRYNFKLEYETNYKVWIDKGSTGIFNTYKDTSFYISTIGFNQPLDYKLDIVLDELPEPVNLVPKEQEAVKQFYHKNMKPEISETGNEEKSQTELKNDIPNILIPGNAAKSDTVSAITDKGKVKQKSKEEKTEVVITPDTVRSSTGNPPVSGEKKQPLSELDLTRQKAIAEQKAREIENQIALKKAEEEKKRAEIIAKQRAEEQQLLAQQKRKEDSLLRVRQIWDSILLVMMQEQKAKEDSLARIKVALAKMEKAKQDSIIKVKTQQAFISKRKEQADSVARAKEIVQKKAAESSHPQPLFLTKTQEELIAAAEMFARRKKFIQDSIARIKTEELKKADSLKKNE